MLLESERLILRDFSENDGKDLYEYLSDKEVVKYEPYDIFTKEMAYNEAISRAENKDFVAVCLKENNKLIGNLYYHLAEPKKVNTYEIGYVFNKLYHGKGYATEAVKCLLEHIFITLQAHRVVAYCNTKNTNSYKLLERVGFRREAIRIDNMYFDVDGNGNPLWFSSYQYAILSREYIK